MQTSTSRPQAGLRRYTTEDVLNLAVLSCEFDVLYSAPVSPRRHCLAFFNFRVFVFQNIAKHYGINIPLLC